MINTTSILVTLVVYKIVLIFIGFWANKRTNNTSDYILGGRKLGPWVAALSASASSSSAWTLLGVSGAAYLWGLPAIWLFPATLSGFLINWLYIAPKLNVHSKKIGALTLTDVLATSDDGKIIKEIRWFASAIILFCFVFYIASQFDAAGQSFQSTFGMNKNSSIILGALIILIYTLLGGFWAVSVSDTLQGIMMALSAIILPIAAVTQVGLGSIIASFSDQSIFSSPQGFGGIIGIGFIGALLIYGFAKTYPQSTNKIMPRSTTWVNRIDSYISTEKKQKLDQDYQQQQALVAIYNGGFSGVGPGKSTQRNILPYSSSDFIFAIMVEEYGFIIGAVMPILFYLILFYRALRIAIKITSVFGGLLCVGLMFSLVFQAFINMLVSVGFLPVTGQTLPLISMGGTSILFTCITVGIILSVSNDTSDRQYETA